jgi:hypothetical protein
LQRADCHNTVKFIDKSRAALNKLKDLKLILPEKGIFYHFILAIQESYPDYARTIHHDLPSDKSTTLDAVIYELNDEARRDDPVKAAAFAANKKTQSAHQSDTETNSQNNRDRPRGGGGHGRGRGRGGNNTNNNGRSGSKPAPNNTPPPTPTLTQAPQPPKVVCTPCGRTHVGGGVNCWINNPSLAPA